MLDKDWQQNIASSAEHHARLAWAAIAEDMTTPSVRYRPSLSIDGDQWCALYGANLQDGVAGFGKSPAEAMTAFDKAWHAALSAIPQAK